MVRSRHNNPEIEEYGDYPDGKVRKVGMAL